MKRKIVSGGTFKATSMAIRHKFHAQPTERDGMRFDSKLEARYYDALMLAKKAGELLFFLRQVPFHLPGNVTYRLDFLEFWKNGDVRFVDTKGVETESFKAKKRLVETLYPVEITLVKKI